MNNQDLIKQLMNDTGLGMSPCSIALEETNDDITAARALLDQYGAKLAIITVEKRRKAVEEARKMQAEEAPEGERPHHPESASSLQPKEWCPNFQNADTTNEAAEIGTLQHYAAETGDLSDLDDVQAEKVQMCLDFVEQRFDEIKKQYPDAVLEKEVYGDIDEVEWPTMAERSTSGGFVDVVITFDEGRQVEIWDYKFGKWAVEPPDNNLQGIVYVLNHRNRYPQLQKARVGFMMPYLDSIQSHVFTTDDFARLYVRVKRLVALRQHGKNLQGNPCFTTCMWCRNIWNCKELAQEVYQAAQKFAPLKVPEDPDIYKINSQSDVSGWVQFADVCKAYAQSIRERCTELVLENEELCPESHDLVNQTDSKIPDNHKFIEFLRTQGVNESVLQRIIKVTKGDAEKAFKDMAERGRKTQFAEEQIELAKSQGLIVPDRPKIFLRAKRQKGTD